jgi:hypothetical protein
MNEIANIYGEQSPSEKSTTTEMMISKESQQVQVQVLAAKKFPRDEIESYNRIMRACQRKSLAEQAEYEYPRGGQKVSGPSIRLAEVLAQNWGNIDYGVMELDQKDGHSEMMAYAWDLETNTRATRVFSVKHWRDTKGGGYALKDSRDIYETTANFGSRRMRACILQIIPGDVVEAAQQQCNVTLKEGNKEPLIDRVRKMVGAFEKEFSVNKKMIEQFLGCDSEAFSENDFIRLRKVYRSLKDNMAKREDYFEIKSKKESESVKTKLDDKLNDNKDISNKDKSNDESKGKEEIKNDMLKGTPFEMEGDK